MSHVMALWVRREKKKKKERNVSWGALSCDDAGISPADILASSLANQHFAPLIEFSFTAIGVTSLNMKHQRVDLAGQNAAFPKQRSLVLCIGFQGGNSCSLGPFYIIVFQVLGPEGFLCRDT